MVRPPITSVEKSLLTELVETLAKTESQFCCGGIIEVSPEKTLNLLYKVGTGKHALSIDLRAMDPAAIDELLDACSPAAHGRGSQTVYDESYRLARELRQGSFALTMDLVNPSGILKSIASLTFPISSSGGLIADLYKLNSYSTGGFFKSHRDTPKSDRHIGSLVIALPVPFQGGVLRVNHEGKDVLFDWSATVSSATSSGNLCLPWAFLFSDVEHEVLPVTSGTRITLAYEIYVSSEELTTAVPAVDGTSLPSYVSLQAILKNPDFLPNGGRLALALSHSYPVNEGSCSPFFGSNLKGSDAALYRALLALKVPVELRAVYISDDATDDVPAFPPDGYGPRLDEYVLLYTSSRFRLVEVWGMWKGSGTSLIEQEANAHLEPDIIWARKPSPDTYSESGRYIHYGNEPSLAAVYCAAALVLDIPVMGQVTCTT